MPLWATIVVLGVVTGTSGFVIRFLMKTSTTLGKIEQAFVDWGRRLGEVETWQGDRDAELAAYANGYRQRPPEWWRP